MMCLGVFLLGSSFFGTLWASWISWKSISFTKMGNISFIICSNKFSTYCSSSSPFWRSYNSDIGTFQVVPEVRKSLFTFLNSCFFILFWLDVYLFLLFQIIDLSPGFLPFTVGSLYILHYFTLGRFHLFLHFATELNQFCEHPDY